MPISRFDKEKLRREIRSKRRELDEIKSASRAPKDRAARSEHGK